MTSLRIEIITARSRDGDKFAVKVQRPMKLRSKNWWGPEFDGVGEATNYGYYDKDGFAQLQYEGIFAPEWFTCKDDAEKLAELIRLRDWPMLQEPCGRGNTI